MWQVFIGQRWNEKESVLIIGHCMAERAPWGPNRAAGGWHKTMRPLMGPSTHILAAKLRRTTLQTHHGFYRFCPGLVPNILTGCIYK